LVADETGEVEILASEGEMDLRVDRYSESGFGNAAPDQLKHFLTSEYGKSIQGILFNKKGAFRTEVHDLISSSV
jgi:hypothetical protein